VIDWRWEPSVILGCLLMAGGYLYVLGPGRSRFADGGPVAGWRVACFLTAVGLLFLSLASPLDALSDGYLLTAHMVQHLIMTLIVPPLMLLGTPGWLLRPLLKSYVVGPLLRIWTRPVAAFAIFNLSFALIHFPTLYEFTLRNTWAHVGQHLMFIGTALITWWPLLSPLRELPALPYALRMLYICAQTIPGALVGSLITLSDGVIYATYAAAPRVTVLSPREDQQLAGLIMWLGSWVLFFGVLTIVFFIWANREQVRPLRTA
jgi:putative membrane protein